MPYTKHVWANQVAPAINATHLNEMEAGIAASPYGPDAVVNKVAIADGAGGWTYALLANAQIDAAAAIAYSKLNLSGSIVNADIAAGAAIAKSKLAALGIVNADVDAAAAIAASKLASYPSDGTKFLAGDGTWKAAASTTYRKTTAKVVNTTVSATDLFNGEFTLAANDLGSNKVARISAHGDWKQNSGAGADVPRFQLVLGGTTIIDTGAPSFSITNAATREPWSIEIIIAETGATNAQSITMRGDLGLSGDTGGGGTAFTTGEGLYSNFAAYPNFAFLRGWNSATKDGTGTLTLVLNVINASASANYETVLKDALVEIV